jgi:DNA-binding transcriptional LysR family regulator
VEEVAGNDLLLGVVGARLPGVKVNFKPFAEDRLIVAAALGNPLPAKITLAELCTLPFIIRERGSGTRKSLEMLLARQRYTLDQFNICATLGSSAAVKEAIKADLGVSVISRHAVKDELEMGTIRELEVAGWSMTRSFYVVTSPRRTLPHHYQIFLNRLLSSTGGGSPIIADTDG